MKLKNYMEVINRGRDMHNLKEQMELQVGAGFTTLAKEQVPKKAMPFT